MGMLVSVYRTDMDCTNDGISSKAKNLCVVNVSGPFTPNDTTPAAILEKSKHGVVRLVPAVLNEQTLQWEPTGYWVMNGGNFAATSDSRFREAIEALGASPCSAIPIFDRIEF
jgi:hypothetical protein